jgi:hypothetical protein
MRKLPHLPTKSVVFSSTHSKVPPHKQRSEKNKQHQFRSTDISLYQYTGALSNDCPLQALRNYPSVQEQRLAGRM